MVWEPRLLQDVRPAPQPPTDDFQSRLSTATVHEPLFADDCVFNIPAEKVIQGSKDLFSAARENFGLIINTEKMVVMHQPPPHTAHTAPQLSVNGAQLCLRGLQPTRRPNPSLIGHSEDLLKRLQINEVNWEDLALDRPNWRRTVEKGATIHETNHITAAKAKREARKSQLRPPHNVVTQPTRPAHDASGRCKHQSVSLDIFVPTAASGLHQPLCPNLTLSRPPRRRLTLTALPNPHYHPPPLPSSPQDHLRRLLYPPPLHTIQTHEQTSTDTP
nr:unnamed protein product [Spirometra erinaceieuropaei]